MPENKSVLEYLSTSSQEALEAFRISRLDRASRLRAKITEMYESWVQAEVEACIASWILERRTSAEPMPRRKISNRAGAIAPDGPQPGARALPVRRLAAAVEDRLRGQLTLKLEDSSTPEPKTAVDDGKADDRLEPYGGGTSAKRRSRNERADMRPTLLMFPAGPAAASETSCAKKPSALSYLVRDRALCATESILRTARCSL